MSQQRQFQEGNDLQYANRTRYVAIKQKTGINKMPNVENTTLLFSPHQCSLEGY